VILFENEVLADVIKGLEMGRLSWIIWEGFVCNDKYHFTGAHTAHTQQKAM
jgi:hypothetical protein